MSVRAALYAALLLLAACATAPFQEAPRVLPAGTDPRSVVEHFSGVLPENFQLLNSIVFEYNRRAFQAIGVIEIDARSRRFKVACMNPLGVKIFELTGGPDFTETRFMVPPLAKYGELAVAVAEDIRRIYFDLLPARDTAVWSWDNSVRFRRFADAGILEHVFAGADMDLVEKNYYEEGAAVWRAFYYEYGSHDGKRYPRGIVLSHYDYGYRLIVHQKEPNS